MQRLIRLLCFLLLFSAPLLSQSIPASQQTVAQNQNFTTTTSGPAVGMSGTSTQQHAIQWWGFGTVSSCAVKLEQSATGTGGWTDLIADQDCSTNGSSSITAGTPNFVRITVGTLTGGGRITVRYVGYNSAPAGGGAGGGSGPIEDGVSSGILATVKDYTNSNPLTTIIVDTNGDPASVGGGTQYTEGGTDASITGNAILWEGAANTLTTVAAGTPLPVDLGTNNDVTVTSGTITAVTTITNPVTVTDGSGALNVIVDSSALPTGAATLTEQQTQTTALQLIDNPVAVLGTATYTEATSSGFTIGAVRRDADTTLVNTTNEIGPLQMDANGRLKVEAFSGETLPVSLTSTTVTGTVAVTQSGTWDEVGINDSGNSITVDNGGTFAVQVDGAALTALQLIDNLPNTQGSTTSGQSGALVMGAVTTAAPSYTTAQTSPLSLTTSGELRVAGTFNAGIVQVNDDMGASQNVGYDTGDLNLPTQNVTDGATAAAVPTWATYVGMNESGDLTGMTGDGSGNLNVNCASGCAGGASTPADNFSNPTTAGLQMGFNMVYDGSTWDMLRGDSTNGALVNLGANNDVTVTSGTITAVTTITNPVTVTDGAGALNVIVDSGTLAVTGPLTDTELRATPVPVATAASDIDIVTQTGTNGYAVAIIGADGMPITSFGGGTQYTEDAAAASDPVGTAPILVRADTPAGVTTTNGDNVAQRGTDYGAAFVQVVDSSGNFIDTFGGSGGTASIDDADFTQSTTQGTPAMGVYESSPTSITDGDMGIVGLTQTRAMRTSAESVIPGTGATNLGKAEDAVHGSGDTGIEMLCVRNNAGTALSADGDYIPCSTDSAGRIYVSATLPSALPSGSNTLGSIVNITTSVVSGTCATCLSKGEDNPSANGDTGIAVFAIRDDTLDARSGLEGDYEPLHTDAAGALWVNGSGYTQPVSGTVTVTDGSGALNIICDSGCASGGSTTPADDFANPTTAGLSASFGMVYDGSTWDLMRGDSTNGMLVNLGANNDVTVTSGTITAVTTITNPVTVTDGAGALNVIIDSGTTAVTNGGTFVVQENGAALTALQLIDDPVYVDDTATHSTGSSKVFGIGAAAAPTDTAVNANDIGMVGMTVNRALYTDAFSWAGTTLGTPTNFGTTPTAVVAGSVNASMFSGTTALGTPNTFGTTAPTGNALGTNASLFVGTTLASAATNSLNSTGGGIQAVQNVAQCDATTPTSLTENQFGNLRMDCTTHDLGVVLPAETTKVIGTIRVQGNVGGAFDAASGAAPPANRLAIGGITSGATGGFMTGLPVCDSFANVTIATATTTLLVTGVSGRHVRICSISLVTAAANNVALISGTGATCGTGTTGMTGGTTSATGWNFAANGGLTQGSGIGTINQTNATGDSVCAITSAATQLSGRISYTIY